MASLEVGYLVVVLGLARFRCLCVGVLPIGVYAIALHGALTGGRPHRLRHGAGWVWARDPTAAL
eukprot:6196907-Pleurochrysis_carterae.AAC.1